MPVQGGNQDVTSLLQRALKSFHGHAPFACLGDIHRLAVEQTELECSMDETANYLEQLPEVRVEIAPQLSQSRVYASTYWSPTGRAAPVAE